jgi:hypothetical protein
MQAEEALGSDTRTRGTRAQSWSRAIAARSLAVWAAAMVLTVPMLDLTWRAARAASYTTLGRDQGIFQYVAWALSRGAVDYRDIRDVNGPLTHVVHWIFLALGGRDEHRFHVLDFGVSAVVFFFAGASLAEMARSGHNSADLPRDERRFARLAWGLAGLVVLGAQYLRYLFWDLAQRESFCNWFLLSSLALCVWAQTPAAPRARRSARTWALAVAGACGAIACFGKHTYALFVGAELATIVVVGDAPGSRGRRLGAYALGLAAGGALGVGFLLLFGDIRAFATIWLHDAPAMYRYIWPHTPEAILAKPWAKHADRLAYGTTLSMLALIAVGWMPRRLLAVALAPSLGLYAVFLQRKGFPYHFHAYSATIFFAWLAAIAWAIDSFCRLPSASVRRWGALAFGLAGAAVLTTLSARAMQTSPHIQNPWPAELGRTAEARESRPFLDGFKMWDFFPWEMRQTAAYLRSATRPDERVQTYGMDPYVLFLAERMSATPYIYAYDLNVDAATSGAQELLDEPEASRVVAGIEAMALAHRTDLMKRVTADPPAAFVFFDKAPLVTWQDSFDDLRRHDAGMSEWISERYVETAAFGDIHVWLRRDRVP